MAVPGVVRAVWRGKRTRKDPLARFPSGRERRWYKRYVSTRLVAPALDPRTISVQQQMPQCL